MRWTQSCRKTGDTAADERNRVVLIPRRWDQVLSMKVDETTGANKPGTPGRARSSRKTIAQGVPE